MKTIQELTDLGLHQEIADLKRKLAISRSALERILHPHHSREAATPPSWAIAAEALAATKL
jgi:hypothetical protein